MAAREAKPVSSGSYLASLLPMGKEGLPVTWQLGVALGAFMVLFNQGLFMGMEALALMKGDGASAANFVRVSIGAGVVAGAFQLFLLAIARPKRWTDGVAAGLSVGLPLGFDLWFRNWAVDRFAAGFFGFNLLLAMWLTRGLWLGSLSKKRENR